MPDAPSLPTPTLRVLPLEDAAIDELGHEPTGLPPIPADLAARARRAISQLTSLDTEVRLAMGRLGAELSLLDRARPASRPPHYVDTSA